MTPNEKLCTLVFDEMSIKEAVCYDPKHDVVRGFEHYAHLGRSRYIANHTCVFMARRLTANWKQPFGFVFSSGAVKDVLLKQLILIAITELEQIGLCVKAVICDQGSNNMDVTKSLGVSSATPYFMHNGTQYFVIYNHRIAPKMCRTCSQTLTTTASHPEHVFIHEKNYSSATSLLLTASKYVTELFLQLENAYISQCVRRCFTRRLRKKKT
ncbi:transposable element p transposase [Plakobranchus ocellatus]|uniref:Transposable element p transposase n=1 Tax=Plakobranchus ocellatus TaxID=259542 RepID=A0AAV4E046_9GAST|nr:transposable element p transposase [Plakobranchus ocellatus]